MIVTGSVGEFGSHPGARDLSTYTSLNQFLKRLSMKTSYSRIFVAALLAASVAPAMSQDVGRVSPATLPVPLPAAVPVYPETLRAHNRWTLPMTGTWRFALTHGRIMAGGEYESDQATSESITASSNQPDNPPQHAFDNSTSTRWCADGHTFPEWMQADLGHAREIAGITLAWERPNEKYRYRIEGSRDAKHWKTLANASAPPGKSDGPVSIPGVRARFVRITVLGSSGGGWASIREFRISTLENGRKAQRRPPTPAAMTAANRDAFASPGFDDTAWDNLCVPSNWEIAGYSPPTYNSVDNTVGQYRRWVTVPAAWAGRRIYWRFDGALDGAEVFVNGKRAGYHESGYTAWDIDLTGLVRPGRRNLFAVRVSKTTPSVDCETGDFQCMGGIYRETFLTAVPQTHVSDITVRTPLDANYRDASLQTQAQVQGAPGAAVELAGRLYEANGRPTAVTFSNQGRLDATGKESLSLKAHVKAPKLWNAEKPNLYYAVYQLSSGGKPVERVEQRFGFRQIEIKNNIVLWNGRPIKCTGTCRHDFWADKGFALTDKEWNKDLTLMKAANINAIRTSHYNHAARFLELCDERGMYILDEVPFCWIGDKVKDPKYAPYILQRTTETLDRDKNRPCVLAWSLGNENPVGPDSQEVMDLVKKMDPTRPAFVSSTNPGAIKGQAWEDDHYPGPGYVDRIAANTRWGANFSEHPHIFYQKETQDYDPGASDLWSEALSKTWDKLWKDPTILGSFIWEWQNQGIADKYPDKKRDLWYGPDHLRQENNKGIVTAYRVPKPEWWIVKMVYSPVVIATRTVNPSGGTCAVPLTNHYSFTDLKELSCKWTAFAGNKVLRTGVTHIACGPWKSVQASFPAPAGMTKLRLEFDHPDGSSVVAANLSVPGAPLPAPPPSMGTGGRLTVQDSAETLNISSALQQIRFDKSSGLIRSWRVHGKDIMIGGPIMNLGEGKAGRERNFYRSAQPPVTEGAEVTALTGADGNVRVLARSSLLAGKAGATLGSFTCIYNIKPDAEITVNWDLVWSAPDINLWEEGLKFTLPTSFTRMRWLRDSYFTDYPAGHMGEPLGSCRSNDVRFRASKRSLRWLTLTNAAGAGIALLSRDDPLVGRGAPGAAGTTLFASREVAGPRDFSGAWVSDHDIRAVKGRALSGAFTLRAIGVTG